MDWIAQFYASAVEQGEGLGVDMPDFDSFWEQGFVEFPVTEEGRSFVRYADFRDDPLLEPLGTPTGV
jgi:trimethylamine-N-oxide reductase (cytochrome c)